MILGSIIPLTENPDAEFEKLQSIGLTTCQLCCWNLELLTDLTAEKVKAAVEKHSITITAFWCGWSGPCEWNFEAGPLTLGIVPTAYRMIRC